MLSHRRQRRLVQTGYYNFHYWTFRTLSIFGIVVGKLDSVQIRSNNQTAIRIFQTFKFRHTIERQMQFRYKTFTAQSTNSIGKFDLQILYTNQLQEGALRIRRRYHPP